MISIILIGISLSMDAFSLAFGYGTKGISKRDKYILSIIVGLFHFFMPLFGLLFGKVLLFCFSFNIDFLVLVIFGIIGIEMVLSGFRDEKVSFLDGMLGYLMFGFSVSIDSFTTGIGLVGVCDNYLFVSSVFMICSFLFTLLGLNIGNYLNARFGRWSNVLGGVIFLLFVVYYLLGFR